MEHLQLGDKIKSNGLLSPIAYGEIIGVEIGYMYYVRTGGNPEHLANWQKYSPNWLHEPVYLIKKYLPDYHVYINDPDVPIECREQTKARSNNMTRRFIAYMPVEIAEKLSDDYDWTQAVEQIINHDEEEDD